MIVYDHVLSQNFTKRKRPDRLEVNVAMHAVYVIKKGAVPEELTVVVERVCRNGKVQIRYLTLLKCVAQCRMNVFITNEDFNLNGR